MGCHRRAWIGFVALAAISSAGLAIASAGGLDPTFGTLGVAGTPITALSQVVSDDGRLTIAGATGSPSRFALARLRFDGSVDPTFGTGGVATLPIDATESAASSATSLVDGSIYAAGHARGVPGHSSQHDVLMVARYDRVGHLDRTFAHDGYLAISLYPDDPSSSNAVQVVGITAQRDGKLLVLAYAAWDGYGQQALMLERFGTDGRPDRSFGSQGIVVRPLYGYIGLAGPLLQRDGRILIFQDAKVTRLRANGTVDSGFGTAGSADLGLYIGTAALSTDDGIVVAAAQNGAALDIARFDRDGVPDASFGNAGQVHALVARCAVQVFSRIYPCPSGSTGLVVQRDGRIVQIGGTYEDQTLVTLLVRYLPDGSLDPSFGTAGVAPAHPPGMRLPFQLQNTIAGYAPATEAMYVGGDSLTRFLLAPTAGAMAVSTSANPSAVTTVTLTATVSGASPSGAVTFLDAGVPIAGCIDIDLTALSATGALAVCRAMLATGTHHVEAAYFGNPTNSPRLAEVLVQSIGIPADTTVIEYFNSASGDYFITSSPSEQAALDGATTDGWQRTGERFSVFAADAPQTTPLCRSFSGGGFAPRSVHFFARYGTDDAQHFGLGCQHLDKPWSFEGYVMRVMTPLVRGGCVAGTRALYRLYDGARSGIPVHRYVVSVAFRDALVAQGWIAEGDGGGVMGCVPV
jgi:uncharacterized delta-60 repeat protein